MAGEEEVPVLDWKNLTAEDIKTAWEGLPEGERVAKVVAILEAEVEKATELRELLRAMGDVYSFAMVVMRASWI